MGEIIMESHLLIISLFALKVCVATLDNSTTSNPSSSTFTWPDLASNGTTSSSTSSTFTWPAINNSTTNTNTTPKSTSPFTWPSLQTTPSGLEGNDLIPIIIGAALGGLVVIVLSGYFIVQMRLRKKRAETDRETLIEQ